MCVWYISAREARPEFDALSRSGVTDAVRFLVVDEAKCPEAVDDFRVRAFPTFVRVTCKGARQVTLDDIEAAVGGPEPARRVPRDGPGGTKGRAQRVLEYHKCDVGLRSRVAHMKEDALAHRGGTDVYT